jgi:molecular chaperone Hsp33
VKAGELLDPLLDAQALLYRLFHEEGVRVFPAHELSVGCRCSRKRIEDLLMSMSANDRADMIVDGKADVHCQFCNKSELFTPQQLGLAVKQ